MRKRDIKICTQDMCNQSVNLCTREIPIVAQLHAEQASALLRGKGHQQMTLAEQNV